MKLLEDKIRFFRELPHTLNELAVKVLREAAPQISDKIVEQLKRGERGDGSTLPNYSPRSVAVFGKPFGPIKLYETGDYYSGMKADVSEREVTINNTDYKEDMLVGRFGPAIQALQQRSKDELKRDVLIPYMEFEVRNLLFR